MLETRLRQMIPAQADTFAKLTDDKDPYHFDCWREDRSGSPCLKYWFLARDGVKKNKKRLPISEIRAALQQLLITGALNRKEFEKACPKAKSDGPCGFAVVGRILEALHVASFSGRIGFKLTNANEATQLLAIEPSASECR